MGVQTRGWRMTANRPDVTIRGACLALRLICISPIPL